MCEGRVGGRSNRKIGWEMREVKGQVKGQERKRGRERGEKEMTELTKVLKKKVIEKVGETMYIPCSQSPTTRCTQSVITYCETGRLVLYLLMIYLITRADDDTNRCTIYIIMITVIGCEMDCSIRLRWAVEAGG